jgi:NifU-like protein involved in Fe-S cluster formation
VREHFEHPRNLGRMADATVEGEASNPVCGDRLKLFLKLEGGRIERASFQAQGCPASIAAGSMATEMLRGLLLEEARRLTDEDVEKALGGLPSGKRHCSVLARDAVTAALEGQVR